MNEDVQNYLNKYSDELKQFFMKIREQIMESIPCEAEERLWAKLPSYYVGNNPDSMYYSFFLKNPF